MHTNGSPVICLTGNNIQPTIMSPPHSAAYHVVYLRDQFLALCCFYCI